MSNSLLSTAEFKISLQSPLGKLAKLDTQHEAHEEIRRLLFENGRSPDKLSAFFNALSELSDRLNLMQRKEFVKLYGVLAEVLEGEAVEYISKIVAALQKKLKEADTQLHEAISYSFGELVHNTLHTIPDLPTSCSQLSLILKPLFINLTTGSKQVQVGSALALKSIVQYAPIECLRYLLEKLIHRLVDLLDSPVCKCHTSLFECLIAIVLSVEQDYAPYVETTLPVLLRSLNSEEFSTRKATADCVYTYAVVLPLSVKLYAGELIEALTPLRSDRVKPVREAAIEALGTLRELEPKGDVRGDLAQKATSGRIEEEVALENSAREVVSRQKASREEAPKKAPSRDAVAIKASREPVSRQTVSRQSGSRDTTTRENEQKGKPMIKCSGKETTGEQKKPKSIFKGPINKNFFKAAENGTPLGTPNSRVFAVEARTQDPKSKPISPSSSDVLGKQPPFAGDVGESQASLSEDATNRMFSQTIWASIPQSIEAVEDPPELSSDEFSDKEPVRSTQLSPPSMPSTALHSKADLQERVRQLEDQNLQLLESFAGLQKHYRSENRQLHQRMSGLEEMLSTMNQLFEAKIRNALTQRSAT
jgi:hypothetical protein